MEGSPTTFFSPFSTLSISDISVCKDYMVIIPNISPKNYIRYGNERGTDIIILLPFVVTTHLFDQYSHVLNTKNTCMNVYCTGEGGYITTRVFATTDGTEIEIRVSHQQCFTPPPPPTSILIYFLKVIHQNRMVYIHRKIIYPCSIEL